MSKIVKLIWEMKKILIHFFVAKLKNPKNKFGLKFYKL